jgi:hypothetical protein
MGNEVNMSAPSGGGGRVNTKAAGVVGLAVMCSRILGLIREQVFAALFGGGLAMDAFTVAFRTPNLLRDMFAEGALSTAFVTTFSKKISTDGDAAAWRLANKVATLTIVFLSAVTLIGILIAPLLVKIFANGFFLIPGKAELTILLARIMYPFIILVSLAALVMGMLNAKNVFGVPAIASSFFNLGSITGGVAIGWWLDPHFGQKALIGLAIGRDRRRLWPGGQLSHPVSSLAAKVAAKKRCLILARGAFAFRIRCFLNTANAKANRQMDSFASPSTTRCCSFGRSSARHRSARCVTR